MFRIEFQEEQTVKAARENKKEVPEEIAEFVAGEAPLFETEARGWRKAWDEVIKPLY